MKASPQAGRLLITSGRGIENRDLRMIWNRNEGTILQKVRRIRISKNILLVNQNDQWSRNILLVVKAGVKNILVIYL